ncbi:MAG: APC family permease [Gemmatimonadetes bacterium]|nr:APC family permease [Gemmatimonadota bacterium]
MLKRPSHSLLRVLGVTFGLAVTVGNTVGAGILRAPGEVAARVPGLGLYLGVWIVGGVYALLGAVSLAELGAMVPRSGGMYVFVHRAMGRYAGFVVGYNDWIATAGSCAAVSVVIGEYLGILVPALGGAGAAVAVATVAAFAVLQWQGIRASGRTQELTSLLKALVLLALVVACFVLPSTSPAPATKVAAPALSLGALVIALQAVFYTYDGWTGILYFGGEVKDPARDIPRSMFGGVLAVMAIYLLLNLAFLYVVPLPALRGEPLAAGAAARSLWGAAGDTVVRTVVVLGLLSSVNALLLMAPRVIFAMSRDGLCAERVSVVNRGGTPTGALLASLVVAVAFIASGSFDEIIAVLAFFFVANYVLAAAAVFVLRRREPDTPRPYRAWGYPWTTGITLAGSLAFLAGSVLGDTRHSVYALLLLAVSYPVYLLSERALRGRERAASPPRPSEPLEP